MKTKAQNTPATAQNNAISFTGNTVVPNGHWRDKKTLKTLNKNRQSL